MHDPKIPSREYMTGYRLGLRYGKYAIAALILTLAIVVVGIIRGCA